MSDFAGWLYYEDIRVHDVTRIVQNNGWLSTAAVNYGVLSYYLEDITEDMLKQPNSTIKRRDERVFFAPATSNVSFTIGDLPNWRVVANIFLTESKHRKWSEITLAVCCCNVNNYHWIALCIVRPDIIIKVRRLLDHQECCASLYRMLIIGVI